MPPVRAPSPITATTWSRRGVRLGAGRVSSADVLGHGQPVGVAQDRGRVAVLDPVVLGLVPARVARHAAGLAQLLEALLAAGDELVDVGQVAGVPQDAVVGGVEHPVEGQGELDDAQVGAEVAAAGAGDGAHDEVADLLGQRGRAPAR